MVSPFSGATNSSSPASNPFAQKPTNGAANPFAVNKQSDASSTHKPLQNGGSGVFGAPSGGGSQTTGFGGFGAANSNTKQTTFGSGRESDKNSASQSTGFSGFGATNSNNAKRTTFGSGKEVEGKSSSQLTTFGGLGATNNKNAKKSTFGSARESSAELSDGGRSKGKRKAGHKKKGSNGDAKFEKRAATPNGSRPASAANSGPETTAPFPPPAIPDSNDSHSQKVYTQLRKDGIAPPKWPSDPGNPNSSNKMSKFREEYELYRDRVRKSLTKAGIIDDPMKRRALKDAIEFKGICEEMCPEFEKIRRITEFDVQGAEKDIETNHPARDRMVKKLARSAAGQEAPLPMDVRSISCLRRTLNYLVDDLLQQDSNLPAYHGFLWDRTRAIRRDFTFFSSLEPDELQIQVYVLENIARFHVASLHLLSRADVKPEGFSEQQEREQLGKTLLSLRDVYDDCNMQGIVCENETEFRAYYLVFHAMSPMILETLQRSWKKELWRDSDEIRTAVSLVEALQSTDNFHGPLLEGPTMAVSGGYHAYFRILQDSSVSYTMACFAEMHFAQLRRSILQSITKPLARPQGETTDVSASTLNRFLRFDTVEEAIDFAEEHGLEFSPDPEAPGDIRRQILKLQRNQQLGEPKLFHQYSQKVVEHKRGTTPLPAVIHQTTYSDPNAQDDTEESEKETIGFAEAGVSSSLEPQTEQPQRKSFSPFSSFGQKPAAVGIAAPNGVSAPQFQQTNSPFGGLSTQPAPAPSNPFGGFKPAENKTSSFSQPETSAVSASGGTQVQEGQGGKGQDDQVPSVPPAPKANPFAGLFQPKPSNEISASAGTSTNTLAAGPTQGTTTPQGSPPQRTFPSTTVPASSVGGSAASSGAKPQQQASNPFNFKPAAAAGSGPSSSLPNAEASKDQQAISGSGLAPSPFAPKPAATNASIFPTGNQDQQPNPTTIGLKSSSANDLFKPLAPPQPPAPPKDLMGSFANWFVNGDGGLMDDFQKYILPTILEVTWAQFHREEKERKKREEEEATEREIEEFRVKNIRIKTFYKWKRTARELRLARVRREGREELRAWRIAEAEKKREEAAQKAAEDKRKRKEAARAAEEDNRLSQFIQRKKVKRSQAEKDLIASGVLKGVNNEKEHARRIVHRTPTSAEFERPSTSDSKASSSVSTARKGGKLQALRDQWGDKREGFRRSLPPGWSRDTASPEPKSRGSAASDRWRLKAMGLVEMPDGTALPERIADEMLLGRSQRRYAGLDARPRSTSVTAPFNRQTSNGSISHPFRSSLLSRSTGTESAQPSSPPNKRKRTSDDTTDASPNKRVMSDSEKLVQELRAMREDLEEGTQWFKQHNDRFASEYGGSRGTTPWDDNGI